MQKKEEILYLYYEKKKKSVFISKEINVSASYITKVIKNDPRYMEEKEIRKKTNKINRNKKKVIWNKIKREKMRKERLDGIMEMQHIQASIELSGRKTINNRAFRNWNSSIYRFYDGAKEYRVKEEKEIYEIDNRKYIVTTKVIENAQGLNNLYEAFSKYALKRLNITI